jgi:hypothetical protein
MSKEGRMRVPPKLLSSLIKEPLYKDHLLKDMRGGEVFMAFRRRSVDFYHAGSKLFGYDDGSFRTHRHFIPLPVGKDYVTQIEAESPIQGVNYSIQYEEIKKRCLLYAGYEGRGVSFLLKRGGYLLHEGKNDICCLDVEITFQEGSSSPRSKPNRIDILLFNAQTRALRFVEAKHFSNGEVWALEGRKPKVVSQIAGYNDLIKAQAGSIVADYALYVEKLNETLGLSLPTPTKVDPDCRLFIFGFDRDQQQGRLRKLLLEDGSLEGIRHYLLGDPRRVSVEQLWHATDR